MSYPRSLARWGAVVKQAARQVLAARSTPVALEAARAEYRALHAAAASDARAVRKAGQRLQGLEQLRAVLAGELQVGR
jgi:hypothetical protein